MVIFRTLCLSLLLCLILSSAAEATNAQQVVVRRAPVRNFFAPRVVQQRVVQPVRFVQPVQVQRFVQPVQVQPVFQQQFVAPQQFYRQQQFVAPQQFRYGVQPVVQPVTGCNLF